MLVARYIDAFSTRAALSPIAETAADFIAEILQQVELLKATLTTAPPPAATVEREFLRELGSALSLDQTGVDVLDDGQVLMTVRFPALSDFLRAMTAVRTLKLICAEDARALEQLKG